MSRESMAVDRSVLAMALVGYEIEKAKIEEKINEIRAQIGAGGVSKKGRPSAMTDGFASDGQPKRRKFSAAARKRMAAAQRKRWAEKRGQKSTS